jgi:hypothetical protein
VPEVLTFHVRTPASTAPDRAVREHQQRVLTETVATFQQFLEDTPVEQLEGEMETISSALAADHRGATALTEEERAKAALVDEITRGRTYSSWERRQLGMFSLLRSFALRRELLADSLTAPQVANILGVSRQTPHDRRKSDTLLAVFDRGAWQFPAWQFDPEGPDGVVAGLPRVLKALHLSPLAKANWLMRPNRYLQERSPLEALKAGEVESVARIAEAVGVA